MWVAHEWRLQSSQPKSEQRGCLMLRHVGSQHTGQHFAKSVCQNRQTVVSDVIFPASPVCISYQEPDLSV